jgi:hypothetical protein
MTGNIRQLDGCFWKNESEPNFEFELSSLLPVPVYLFDGPRVRDICTAASYAFFLPDIA